MIDTGISVAIGIAITLMNVVTDYSLYLVTNGRVASVKLDNQTNIKVGDVEVYNANYKHIRSIGMSLQ